MNSLLDAAYDLLRDLLKSDDLKDKALRKRIESMLLEIDDLRVMAILKEEPKSSPQPPPAPAKPKKDKRFGGPLNFRRRPG